MHGSSWRCWLMTVNVLHRGLAVDIPGRRIRVHRPLRGVSRVFGYYLLGGECAGQVGVRRCPSGRRDRRHHPRHGEMRAPVLRGCSLFNIRSRGTLVCVRLQDVDSSSLWVELWASCSRGVGFVVFNPVSSHRKELSRRHLLKRSLTMELQHSRCDSQQINTGSTVSQLEKYLGGVTLSADGQVCVYGRVRCYSISIVRLASENDSRKKSEDMVHFSTRFGLQFMFHVKGGW